MSLPVTAGRDVPVVPLCGFMAPSLCVIRILRTSGPSQSPPTAGRIVGQQQLLSYLEKALEAGPRNVLLFLQDKVHTDTH